MCMTRKFHNDKPHTNQQHREEETRISGFHMTARSPIKEINPRILFAYKEFSIPGDSLEHNYYIELMLYIPDRNKNAR